MSEIEVTLDEPKESTTTSEPAKTNGAAGKAEPAQAKTESAESHAEPAKSEPAKPAGYDAIDIETATPEQIKERMNYIYKQMKDNEREKREGNRTLKQYREIAEAQSRQIEELTRSQGLVINHLQDKNIIDTETQLTELMQKAFERGDNKAYQEAQNKLLDIKVEKKLLADKRQAQPQQRQVTQQQPSYNSAADISRNAAESGELSDADSRITEAWQDERDTNGQPLRPWAYASNPMFNDALREGQAVFNNPMFKNRSHEEKLAEIDRRMGVQKRTVGQNVIEGNLQTPRKTTRVTLTPEIERMVIRTKWGDTSKKKYKTDDERLSAYAKQMATVQKGLSKGVRR